MKRYWQKGFVYGFLFSGIVSLILAIIVIVFDVIADKKGIPHFCYMVTKTAPCGLTEAISSRFGFFAISWLVFGIPIGIIAGLVGYAMEKIQIQ
jgi:hypothetical protein